MGKEIFLFFSFFEDPCAPKPICGPGYQGTMQTMPDGTQTGTIMLDPSAGGKCI